MNATLQKIKNAKDRQGKQVTIDEWGVTLFVRPITLDQKCVIEDLFTDDDRDTRECRKTLLQFALHDEHGEPLIPTDADADVLFERSAPICEGLFETALEVSKLYKDAAELAEKNSGSDPTANSS